MWWCAVTIIGTCEVRRIPLRRVASGELSPVSGSNAASADTAVRKTSMGCESFTARTMSHMAPGSSRASFSAPSNAPSSAASGSSPCSRRQAVSSNDEYAARSWIEYPRYRSSPARPSMSVVGERSKHKSFNPRWTAGTLLSDMSCLPCINFWLQANQNRTNIGHPSAGRNPLPLAGARILAGQSGRTLTLANCIASRNGSSGR